MVKVGHAGIANSYLQRFDRDVHAVCRPCIRNHLYGYDYRWGYGFRWHCAD
jgi:hypothetical protein